LHGAVVIQHEARDGWRAGGDHAAEDPAGAAMDEDEVVDRGWHRCRVL